MFFHPGITCNRPFIHDGSVSPANVTVDYGAAYEVICNPGFGMFGASTMTCGIDGVFDQTPTCGKYFP